MQRARTTHESTTPGGSLAGPPLRASRSQAALSSAVGRSASLAGSSSSHEASEGYTRDPLGSQPSAVPSQHQKRRTARELGDVGAGELASSASADELEAGAELELELEGRAEQETRTRATRSRIRMVASLKRSSSGSASQATMGAS